jgi:hypothetical protein
VNAMGALVAVVVENVRRAPRCRGVVRAGHGAVPREVVTTTRIERVHDHIPRLIAQRSNIGLVRAPASTP